MLLFILSRYWKFKRSIFIKSIYRPGKPAESLCPPPPQLKRPLSGGLGAALPGVLRASAGSSPAGEVGEVAGRRARLAGWSGAGRVEGPGKGQPLRSGAPREVGGGL